MTISAQELGTAVVQLQHMRRATPWYRLITKFRLSVMIETLIGVINWIADKGEQRSCGCAAHTNPGTN